jgi:hypothetical protein
MKIVLLFIIVLLSIISLIKCEIRKKENRIMTWLCLEFCGDSSENITSQLLQINNHKEIISAVSFERYTLGSNSTLYDNHLTIVSPQIVEMGLEAWPLISSFPHPDEFIDWMRQVFINPQPFIKTCIEQAKLYKYTGYNLDWEPTAGCEDQDAIDYANFIDTFAIELHAHDLLLTVDIASWSNIWNYTAISQTNVDRAISMGTYTSNDDSFISQLDMLYDSFGSRSGIGLETVNASNEEELLPLNEVKFRFDSITAKKIAEVDLWRSPVPDGWWEIISKYVYTKL